MTTSTFAVPNVCDALCTVRNVLLLLSVITLPSQSRGQQEDALVVSVKPAAPFVIVDPETKELAGFSIDLIRSVIDNLEGDKRIDFQIHETVEAHLRAVETGDVDLGISAISISADRLKRFDFSQPFYQSGLDIAVPREDAGLLKTLWTPRLGYTLLSLIGFVFLCANVIWLTERGKTDGFDDRWLAGVGQGIWWTIVTMSTVGYGDFAPRTPVSRVLGVVIIFAGIILFGVSVGALSSAFTVQRLTTTIQSAADLKGQKVSVVAGTVAQKAVVARGAFATPADTLEAAFELVSEGKAVAVVHDLPQLQHKISRSNGDFVLVGKPFDTRAYGIIFPSGSDLQRPINISLLDLKEGETSTYETLSVRWFGAL